MKHQFFYMNHKEIVHRDYENYLCIPWCAQISCELSLFSLVCIEIMVTIPVFPGVHRDYGNYPCIPWCA